MQLGQNISNVKKGVFFVLGILVAVFVVTQELIDYHCGQICAELEQTEADADEPQDNQETVYELVSDVLLPVSNIKIEPFEPVFICKVEQKVEADQPVYSDVFPKDSPYFKTLFRQIISSNAP
ncbi:hypothetical protein [Roseivirga pacifica]|uniref:hypothetical protein n=1 Tax=Roseivirga pacifica TaxID=1267423 RepID=UPI003BAB055E